jgi:hypothetical protein
MNANQTAGDGVKATAMREKAAKNAAKTLQYCTDDGWDGLNGICLYFKVLTIGPIQRVVPLDVLFSRSPASN